MRKKFVSQLNENRAAFKVAFLALAITFVIFAIYHSSASAEGTTSFLHLRSIKAEHVETLLPNSKWRSEPLKSKLNNALSEDLLDTNNSSHVWHFTAEEFDEVREWCLAREKGTDTNNNFLANFLKNRLF